MASLDGPDDQRRQNGGEKAGLGARLFDARFVLAAAVLVLGIAVAAFSLPALYALAGFAAIAVAAAIIARPSDRRRLAGQSASAGTSPDTSMKSVADALSHPAFILDHGGAVRYANGEAARRFPATRPGDLFTLTFRSPELIEAMRSAAAGKAVTVDHHDHGEDAGVYAIAVNPLHQPGDGQDLALVILEDMSERQAIERMRADFVANASHELRTPLASLAGFIDTLQGPARGDSEASDRFLAIMRQQAERMRRLIDDLLSLSRLEMRAHRTPEGRVDLVATIGEVLDTMAPLAGELSVKTKLDAPGEPVEVTGERDELVQVFENLIENGLKYGGAGGRLDIAITRGSAEAGTAARVTIRDYGPGIAPEHLPRLTERFYRVDAEASREKQGTGLGLAIVKHILTHHRAELDFHSEPGAGATVTVTFPPLESPAGGGEKVE
jgi:two-component system phosphate regulon sensor histidine kinase PhoR